MIKPTDEMIAAARDASIALTNHCSTYAETKVSLEAVLAIVEKRALNTPALQGTAADAGCTTAWLVETVLNGEPPQ
jgi:hypothetical protein